MSASFLTTKIPSPVNLIAVEIAWTANTATDPTGTGWTWVDITADVVLKGTEGIRIQIGRPDESQDTQAAEMTLTLDNRSGNYSKGGLGANWPNIRRGVPVRVRVSPDNGSSWDVRFQGQTVGFTPEWDKETGRWATVTLLASGPLRKINQGTTVPTSAFKRYMIQNATAENIDSYWSMEDEASAKFFAQNIGTSGVLNYDNVTNYAVVVPGNPGTWNLGSDSTFACSAPLCALLSSNSSALMGQINAPFPSAGVKQVSGIYAPSSSMSGANASGGAVVWGMTTPQSYVAGYPQVFYDAASGGSRQTAWVVVYYFYDSTYNGTIRVVGANLAGGNVVNIGGGSSGTTAFNNIGTTPFRWRIAWNGSTATLAILKLGSSTEISVTGTYSITPQSTYSYSTFGCLVIGGSGIEPANGNGGTLGHVAYHTASTSLNASSQALSAFINEIPTTRLTRVSGENMITITTLDMSITESGNTPTATMGEQPYDTLTNILRETEDTGAGVLYDGIGPGFTYITKKYREAAANGPAAMTIDASAAQLMEPFVLVDDDQLIINQATASSKAGSPAQYQDTTGPNGTNAVGVFSTDIQVNPGNRDYISYAEWAVAQGTREGYRYPQISFALDTNPALISPWLACTPQSRVDVTNITAVRRQHAAETIKGLLEGWEERITWDSWHVTANTSPAEPWNVIRLAAATGSTGDDICHLDTDGSQLNATVSTGATSIAVKTNTGPLWVTTSGDADSFPFDIDIGGIKATVTAISGASSPQTFTLSAGLPRGFTGSTTVGAGTPIKIWRPPVLGL